jgi:PIN domain nuclease of toxin-antitoxin system
VILADTQIVLWMTLSQDKLSEPAATALRNAQRNNEGVGIASSTLWEIAMLVSKRRVVCPYPISKYLQLVERMYQVHPINADIAERSTLFSDAYPKDPTDRLIGATALVHGLTLVTADTAIRESGEVSCIW